MAVADTQSGAFQSGHSRRYDLDWLRAIAFGLLIFYHVGMFYVTWGWHVKSVYAGPAAEPLMLIVNPWRLALLFFISGAAVRFASDKAVSLKSFAASRAFRLGLPILAGVIILVAPQSYYELRQAGLIEPGFFAFWGDYLNLKQLFPMITPTWNHLWYVVYLLFYILLITPFLPAMRKLAKNERWLTALTGGPVRLLLIVIVPFVLYELILGPRFPHTHDLVNDWANHAHRFTVFLLGYFAAKHARFWMSVDRVFPIAAGLVIVLGILRFVLREYAPAALSPIDSFVPHTIIETLYAWSFILMLFGFAQRYLNQPSKALTYVTGAVFCYYILHQTIIVAAGYYLTQLKLGVWLEFFLVMSITVAGCSLGYEVFRRIPVVRLFFGIKGKRKAEARKTPAAIPKPA